MHLSKQSGRGPFQHLVFTVSNPPNWPLGSALSFIMLTIVLLIMAAASPVLRKHLGATV